MTPAVQRLHPVADLAGAISGGRRLSHALKDVTKARQSPRPARMSAVRLVFTALVAEEGHEVVQVHTVFVWATSVEAEEVTRQIARVPT